MTLEQRPRSEGTRHPSAHLRTAEGLEVGMCLESSRRNRKTGWVRGRDGAVVGNEL